MISIYILTAPHIHTPKLIHRLIKTVRSCFPLSLPAVISGGIKRRGYYSPPTSQDISWARSFASFMSQVGEKQAVWINGHFLLIVKLDETKRMK